MKVIVLTSHRKGSAAFCLEQFYKLSTVQIEAVILSKQKIANKRIFYKRKFKKLLKIGIGGMLNGFRMRKWYGEDLHSVLDIKDIETVCSIYRIPFHIVDGINNKFTINLIQSLKPDLGISLGNSFISPNVFSIPRFGMINLHGEILPDYQNAQSIIWQIYNGCDHTGYTIHEVNRKIDSGRILMQEQFSINFEDTLGKTVTLNCARILQKASVGLIALLSNWEAHLLNAKTQGPGRMYTTPSMREFKRIRKNYLQLKQQQNDKI